MTEVEQLIESYERGYSEVESALRRLTEEELDHAPDGEWTPRQIVHHLADSEMTSAIRLRRLLAEDEPRIMGYDEEEFARRLFYDRPIESSMLAFRGARESTTEILRRLAEKDFSRAGTHSEIGPYSVLGWLQIYASHARDHADQIKRAARS